MRGGAFALAGLEQAIRSQQVGLDRCVEWAVEADGGGGVDDDVAAAQQREIGWGEPEPVDADITWHGGDSPVADVVEVAVPRCTEPLECLVAQDLALHSAVWVAAAARSY